MSNFDFLKNYDEKLYKSAIKIESNVNTSPAAVKTYTTPFLQRVLELLLAKIGRSFNSRKGFYYQLDAVYRQDVIKYGFKNKIYDAYQLRNRLHDDIFEMEQNEFYIARQLHEKLFYIAKKLYTDHFSGSNDFEAVASFKPIEIDDTDSDIDFIEIPDYSEVIDMNYDFCVICGEPNHSGDSLCCRDCNRIMDNANNLISIKNTFGPDAKFTKDDLMNFGIPEGYVNQFVHFMTLEGQLNVKGRFITFSNMGFDDYLSKINQYITVCEMITKFREDKITPAVIKRTLEYKQGRLGHDPYRYLFRIINDEIIKKFERDILTTRDVWRSISYTTITEEQLKRWYKIQLAKYKKYEFNQAFLTFNDLLIEEYLELKSQGILEDKIRKTLNVSDEIYDFWCGYKKYFESNLKQIKLDLIVEAINAKKTREEIIEYAGVTPREYEDIFKLADLRGDEISQIRNREIESRKKEFLKYLYNFNLETACRKAKFSLEDFYGYYETANETSQFYVKSTEYLVDKFLTLRSRGKTYAQAMGMLAIKEKYLNRWYKRSGSANFNDRNLMVTVDLIIRGFKKKKSFSQIALMAEVDVGAIKRYIKLGKKGDKIYRPLYEYYSNRVLPKILSEFLLISKSKSIRKAIDTIDLNEDEINEYYLLGKSGDEEFSEFYNEFLDIKKNTFLLNKANDKSDEIAMRESRLTPEEYEENRDELNKSANTFKRIIVLKQISEKKTSSVAASKANVSVDEIYEWYFKGRDGDETYETFYNGFHNMYVRPNINSIQKSLDNNRSHLDNLIRKNKDQFTKRDVEIWVRNGLLDNKVLMLNNDDEDEDDKPKSKFNANEMLREMGVEDYDKISMRKTSRTSGILSRNDTDAEKLKKEILKK